MVGNIPINTLLGMVYKGKNPFTTTTAVSNAVKPVNKLSQIFIDAPYHVRPYQGYYSPEGIRSVAKDIKTHGSDLPLELTLGTARKESTLGKFGNSPYGRWRSLPPTANRLPVSSEEFPKFAMTKLREGMKRFSGDQQKAARWYNWGEGSKRGRAVMDLGKTALANPEVRKILTEEGLLE